MDTFWNDVWKNPALDGPRGAHSGPNGNCDPNAEWTVIMPINEGN